MARFYGEVSGGRGAASRLGHGSTGLKTVAASWSGAVEVNLFNRDGADWVRVDLRPWNGIGTHQKLYEGPVGGAPVPVEGDKP